MPRLAHQAAHGRFAARDAVPVVGDIRDDAIGIPSQKPAGAGAESQAARPALDFEVVQIALARAAAPMAGREGLPARGVQQFRPPPVISAEFAGGGHREFALVHRGVQRRAGDEVERVEIDAVQADVDGRANVRLQIAIV